MGGGEIPLKLIGRIVLLMAGN